MPLFSYFDGTQMFDFAPKTKDGNPERGEQLNSYAGIDGTEKIDQGFRLWDREVTGIISGQTPSDLKNGEDFWLSYRDGNLYNYTDWAGNVFSNVELISFEPQEQIRAGAGFGYFRHSTIRIRAYTPN